MHREQLLISEKCINMGVLESRHLLIDRNLIILIPEQGKINPHAFYSKSNPDRGAERAGHGAEVKLKFAHVVILPKSKELNPNLEEAKSNCRRLFSN